MLLAAYRHYHTAVSQQERTPIDPNQISWTRKTACINEDRCFLPLLYRILWAFLNFINSYITAIKVLTDRWSSVNMWNQKSWMRCTLPKNLFLHIMIRKCCENQSHRICQNLPKVTVWEEIHPHAHRNWTMSVTPLFAIFPYFDSSWIASDELYSNVQNYCD